MEEIQNSPYGWHLICDEGILTLRHSKQGQFVLPYRHVEHRTPSESSSLVAKACAAKRRPYVLDALGGWGLDAIALSWAGCKVILTEANPLVCAVARNLAREANVEISCTCGNAEDYLRTTNERFDVIYLDPMFPLHRKGALPSRRMQVLQTLAKTDTDLKSLFKIALQHALNRVVVKHRRNQASLLGDPDWQIKGKTVRFDVYRSCA